MRPLGRLRSYRLAAARDSSTTTTSARYCFSHASLVSEEAFWNLDGLVIRISTPHIPLPSAESLEDLTIPSVERIHETIKRSMD